MKVLITGRGGFWGKHQAAFLETQGYAICSVGSHPAVWAEHVVIDMGDPSAWRSVVKQQEPDIILHLAGVARGDATEMERVNVAYAQALLAGCKAATYKPKHIFLAGSGAEYGAVDVLPITEQSPCNPCGLYGATKLKQTQLGLDAFASGMPVTIIRPFNILGVGMPPRLFLAEVIAQLRAILHEGEKPILQLGDLSTVRDFIDVRDLCDATYRLMSAKQAPGEVINVCSGKPVTIEYLLKLFLEASNCEHIEVHSGSQAGGIPEHYGSVEKLQSMLKFRPSITLEETLKWVAENDVKGLL